MNYLGVVSSCLVSNSRFNFSDEEPETFSFPAFHGQVILLTLIDEAHYDYQVFLSHRFFKFSRKLQLQ